MFATVPAQACNWELKEPSQAWVKRVRARALKLVERAILKWSWLLSLQPETNRSVALRPPKHGVRILTPSPVLAHARMAAQGTSGVALPGCVGSCVVMFTHAGMAAQGAFLPKQKHSCRSKRILAEARAFSPKQEHSCRSKMHSCRNKSVLAEAR